jgi:predicted kinase
MNYTSDSNPEIDNPRQIILLRGVSGCGKSTFAEAISAMNPDSVICCADDFFMKDGVYNFDANKLYAAHKACVNKFMAALEAGVSTIIVANTNTSEKDWKPYEYYGKAAGYRVFFVVVENRHGGSDCHMVSEDVLVRQESRIRSSLKLR